MENGHLQDDKLFRAVHDRLSDYEAPSNGADWDAMSRALDNLPKNAGFKMKFSLNSILVIVGLVGVSALSFALVTNKGKSPETKTNSHAVITQPKTNPNPVVPVNNTQPSSRNSFANSNEMGFTGNTTAVTTENTNTTPAQTDVASNNTLLNPDGSVKKRKNKNQLRFGDQIDPKKGFIYNTKENPNVITQPVDQAPNTYYDYDEAGNLKKFVIKKDSTSHATRKPKADSTATIFTPGPTEGGPTGFDME